MTPQNIRRVAILPPCLAHVWALHRKHGKRVFPRRGFSVAAAPPNTGVRSVYQVDFPALEPAPPQVWKCCFHRRRNWKWKVVRPRAPTQIHRSPLRNNYCTENARSHVIKALSDFRQEHMSREAYRKSYAYGVHEQSLSSIDQCVSYESRMKRVRQSERIAKQEERAIRAMLYYR